MARSYIFLVMIVFTFILASVLIIEAKLYFGFEIAGIDIPIDEWYTQLVYK